MIEYDEERIKRPWNHAAYLEARERLGLKEPAARWNGCPYSWAWEISYQVLDRYGF